MRILMSRIPALVAAGLLIVACSDDGDQPGGDTGTPDGPAADRGVTEAGLADAGADQQVADTAPQPDTVPTNPSDWTIVASAPDVLNGVWGLDANNVFAVGKGGAIMFWDGTKWGAMTNPNSDDLYAVWGTGASSTSKVWAVGDGGAIAWDGTSWSTSDSSYSYPFQDMMGDSSNMYAVGDGSDVRYHSYTSTSGYWSSIYITVTSETLHGVWVVGDDQVWAVGDKATILKCTSSCASYSSSNWSLDTVPSGVTSHLRGVWASSATDIFAVGFDGTILHYDGSAWKKMTVNTSTYFHAVWGSGPSDVWAVGNPIFAKDEAIFHYDGSSWTKSPTPKDSMVLYDVWGSGANDVWAVGKTSILHYKK
jgi:hypothetical protein